MSEPEFTAPDGTTRKLHYGTDRQPWDDIRDLGWGPEFCAGNVLKYIRRAQAKNGTDDIAKAHVYYRWLVDLVNADMPRAAEVMDELHNIMTPDEFGAIDVLP